MSNDIKITQAIERYEQVLADAISNAHLAGELGDMPLLFNCFQQQNIAIEKLMPLLGKSKTSRMVSHLYQELRHVVSKNTEENKK